MSIEEAIESLNSPGQLATTQFYNIKNNCASVLNATIDAVQTSLVLVAGGGALFPAAPFYLSCEYEVMKCTGKSTDTLTITRGFDGTTAAAHTAGVIVEQRNNAALWTDLQSAVNNIESGATAIPLNVPDGSITNVKLAPDVIRPSLIVNGGFEQWHRGAGPFTTGGLPTADGWLFGLGGSDSMSVSKDTVNSEFGSCAACTFTLNGGGGATAFYATTNPPASSIVLSDIIGRQVTYSVRIRTNVVNAIRIGLYNGSATVYSAFHNGNNTYQTLTVTTTIVSVATAVNAAVYFAANCTAFVDNATLVIGAAVSNYAPAQIPDVIPNERLGSDVARANLLTDGGFEIWQRGNGPFGIAPAGNGTFIADRWQIFCGPTGTVSAVRDTANADGIGACLAFTSASTPSVASAAFMYQMLATTIDELHLKGKTVTFSARVKTNIAAGVRLKIEDSAGANNYFSAYHTGDNNYQTLVVVGFISASSNNSSIKLLMEKDGNSYIDNAVLVVGSAAADYVPLHPADDLARCLRYYETLGGTGSSPILYYGYGNNAGANFGFYIPFRVIKAVTPTATKNGSWPVVNCGQPNILAASVDGLAIDVAALALGNIQFGNNAAGCFISIEANP